MTSRLRTTLKIIFILGLCQVTSAQIKKNIFKPIPPYIVPMRFDSIGDGVELLPLELNYDVSDRNSIKIGPVVIQEKTLSALMVEARYFDPQLTPQLSQKEARQKYLLFSWPEPLLPEGTLEAISRSGEVIWQSNITQQAKTSWQRSLEEFKARIKQGGQSSAALEKGKLFRIPWGLALGSPGEGTEPLMTTREPFRFCLSKTEGPSYSRICTMLYEIRRAGNQTRMVVAAATAIPPRVLALNKAAPLQGNITVGQEEAVQFFAEIETGISYEFVIKPLPLNLAEITTGEKGQKVVRLVAWGPLPFQPATRLNSDQEGVFERILGWQQTIGDFRLFWETSLDLEKPELYIPGEGGGCLRQKLKITKIPRSDIRPFLDEKTIDSTYINGAKIFGRKRKDIVLMNDKKNIEVDRNRTEFVWDFEAPRRGELNKSYITLKDGDQTFRAYHELYKGYPREISFRTSGILSAEGKTVLMGELAFQYWFEDIFGWTNYILSRQRWGLSVKAFQSLAQFAIGSVTDTLKITTADLKYRFEPGLWNRDQTWGAVLGFQKVEYYSFSSPLLGGGMFWARSMPKVFDDLFNLFPLMNYPKWVDMEYIYYFLSTDSRTRVNFPTYALNFHGKVMWTNEFYGEAGFGIKQYSIDDRQLRLNLRFTSLYGTVGLGLNF